VEILIHTRHKEHPSTVKPGDVITIQRDGWPWSKIERTHPEWRIIKTGELHGTHVTCLQSSPVLNPCSHFRAWAIDFDKLSAADQFCGARRSVFVAVDAKELRKATIQRPDVSDVEPNPSRVDPLVAAIPFAASLNKPSRRGILKGILGVSALMLMRQKAQAGTVTSTIGTSSRNYSTIAAWIASLPSNAVTAGNSYIGACYNDSEFTGTGTIATFTAITTDSSHTITLTAATGQSFQDNAGVRTNALKYNQSNGVGVRKTDNYAAIVQISGIVNYLTLSRLQLSRSATGAGSVVLLDNVGCTNLLCTNLLCNVAGSSGTPWTVGVTGGSVVCSNVLIIVNSSNALTSIFNNNGGPTLFVGCSAVRPSDKTAGGIAFTSAAGSPTLQSSCSFGFTTASSGTWGGSSQKNATDQSSIAGTSSQTSITYSSATPFQDAASTALDLRAIAATSLVGNGYLDSTNAPNDISGSPRPSNPTIGVWEDNPFTPSPVPHHKVVSN